MINVMRVLLGLICTVSFVRPVLAGQQAISEQEKSVPGCLCQPAVSAEDFATRFDEVTRRRWNNSYTVYRKWLKHAEILEYFGSSEENQTFLSSARNVTPDDEVFLRVRRSHPLLYTYTVTIDEADTPEEPLLTIAGSPITTFNPFEIQKAAEVAKAKAEEAGSVSPEPTIDPKSGKTSDPDEMVRFLTGRTARKSSDEWNVRERLIASAQPDFTGSYTQLNRARDRQATYFGVERQ